MKAGFDQQGLIDLFASASAKQGEQLRQAVRQATLGALKGREMSLKNIRDVLNSVTKAASAGAAQSSLPAVDDLERFEDTLIGVVKKSAEAASTQLGGPWSQVLEKLQAGGTMSGAQAASTAEQLAEQMKTAMRDSRAAGLKAAQALAQSYTALVSGVLIGMSDALQQGGTASGAPAKKARK